MSNKSEKQFKKISEKIAFDLEHRKKIQFNISKYNAAVLKGNQRYESIEYARTKAANTKRNAINNLHNLLLQFEQNFNNNGGDVLWASDSDEAIKHILSIANKENAKLVVKSKSMTTEEIDLNEAFENAGITSVESDLGEYIVQLAHEKPYHIVTPAMHKSRQDVADLFHEKFGSSLSSTPEELTLLARKNLRDTFLNADIGITGANFIVSDVGGVAVTENEGNALMSTAFPKIHIAIVGIEKVLPSIVDLAYMWPHLAQHGTGQAITVYNSVFTGPTQEGEAGGAEKMFVILLDNNRSNLLSSQHKVALSCIRCGACLNACPIYKNIGGYTYNTTYQGPIGTVITPHLKRFEEFKHLNTACSVCGNCSEVCPVKIPLHEQILLNRNEVVKKGTQKKGEHAAMKGFATLMQFPQLFKTSGRLKNIFLPLFFKNLWGDKRTFPHFGKSFKSLYKQKKK